MTPSIKPRTRDEIVHALKWLMARYGVSHGTIGRMAKVAAEEMGNAEPLLFEQDRAKPASYDEWLRSGGLVG